jgi:hypothetical protein
MLRGSGREGIGGRKNRKKKRVHAGGVAQVVK